MFGSLSPTLLGVCTITLISRAPGSDLPDWAIALGSEVADERKNIFMGNKMLGYTHF